MKKILFLLTIATTFLINVNNSALAAKQKPAVNIAVVLDNVHFIHGKHETITPTDTKYLIPIVQEAMEQIFDDSKKYNLQPLEKTAGYALTYRQKHGLMKYTDNPDDESTKTLDYHIHGGGLKYKDGALKAICKHFGADYLIYAYIEDIEAAISDENAERLLSANRVKLHIWSNKSNQFIEEEYKLYHIFKSGDTVVKQWKRNELDDSKIAILKNETHDIEKEVWLHIVYQADLIRKVIDSDK